MDRPPIAGPTGSARIAIAGGGVIGLACAFELSRRGHQVTVYDPSPPERSTSWAAAGMIAPAYEVMIHGGDGNSALARFCFESALAWQGFALAIQRSSGLPVGYSSAPTLALARTDDEHERLLRLSKTLQAMSQPHAWRNIAETRERLGLSGTIKAALALPADHQVDNRRLLKALRLNRGEGAFRLVRRAVYSRRDMDGDVDAVIWARGAREAGVETLVKGQALALQPVTGLPSQVIRFGSGYVVPKADRIVIGASSEEGFSHQGVEPRTMQALRSAAIEVLPRLADADLIETWAGLRPKRAGDLPTIGMIAPGEFIATAHYRNGILLAPATALRIADMIEGRAPAVDAAAFAPGAIAASA